MLANSLVLKLFFLFFSVILLSHCTKVVENKLRVKSDASAPFSMPVEAYLAIAKNQSGDEKETMLIMAAARSLYDGSWLEAERILTQTSNLSFIQINEKNILLAKIDLTRGQSAQAIARLSQVTQHNNLPDYFQVQYHEILASSFEMAGNASDSINERIKLEHLVTDEKSRLDNTRSLWLTLTRLPVAELNTLAIEAPDGSELQGWMHLALIPKQHSNKEQSLIVQTEQWQQNNPGHPANRLLPSPLTSVQPFLHDFPQHMALLIPLSGPLAGPGGAVRDGFMAAHSTSNSSHDVNVRLYDTGSGDAVSLYQQALDDGADYIVGPLTKNDVAKVAILEHPVPTLFLNDMDMANSNNAYRFGLSPANEASQVAAKAFKNGLKRALIIAPSGAWGNDIVAAFTSQWKSGGGDVVEILAYDDSTNLSTAVRTFLHVSEKEAQEKQFKPIAGQEIEIAPKRRQDFDMIFLLAYPSKARQIMPLLKYYFAGDVPVFATSSVYSGSINKMRDRDLDGIMFCDMPWVFNNQLGNKNWPEQFNSYSRLYALGLDSYTLATQLNQLLLFPATSVNDKSGALYLNSAQQVARVLSWGKFHGGVAHQINDRA